LRKHAAAWAFGQRFINGSGYYQSIKTVLQGTYRLPGGDGDIRSVGLFWRQILSKSSA
jgi:hypothetical protein